MLLCDHDGVRLCTDQGRGEEAFIQREGVTRDVTESVTDTGLRSGSDELLTDDHWSLVTRGDGGQSRGRGDTSDTSGDDTSHMSPCHHPHRGSSQYLHRHNTGYKNTRWLGLGNV